MDDKYRACKSNLVEIKDGSMKFVDYYEKGLMCVVLCQRGYYDKNTKSYKYNNPEILNIKFVNDEWYSMSFYEYHKEYRNFFIIEEEKEKCKNGRYHEYDTYHGENDYGCSEHCINNIKILDSLDLLKKDHYDYFRDNVWEELMRVFWNPKRKWTGWYLKLE